MTHKNPHKHSLQQYTFVDNKTGNFDITNYCKTVVFEISRQEMKL